MRGHTKDFEKLKKMLIVFISDCCEKSPISKVHWHVYGIKKLRLFKYCCVVERYMGVYCDLRKKLTST